jgi:hypothetical protein
MKNLFWMLSAVAHCCTALFPTPKRPHPLPMTLDFAMMDALVVANYYTDPGKGYRH